MQGKTPNSGAKTLAIAGGATLHLGWVCEPTHIHPLSGDSVPPDWREMDEKFGLWEPRGKDGSYAQGALYGYNSHNHNPGESNNRAASMAPVRFTWFSLHVQTLGSELDSLAGVAGFEPATFLLIGGCSNQLSYTPRPSRAGINMAMLPSLLESYKAIPSLLPSRERFPLVWN